MEAHTVHSLLICQNEKRLDIKKKTCIHTHTRIASLEVVEKAKDRGDPRGCSTKGGVDAGG